MGLNVIMQELIITSEVSKASVLLTETNIS